VLVREVGERRGRALFQDPPLPPHTFSQLLESMKSNAGPNSTAAESLGMSLDHVESELVRSISNHSAMLTPSTRRSTASPNGWRTGRIKMF